MKKQTKLSAVLNKLCVSMSSKIDKIMERLNSGKKVRLPELEETLWKEGDKYYLYSKFTDDTEVFETEGEVEQYLDSALY